MWYNGTRTFFSSTLKILYFRLFTALIYKQYPARSSDVAFLLIDYKGGGMANLFKNLPHLLGTITNLDGAQSMRALASINAEIHRRERLFGEFEVNHINQYQKKFKNGEATEPLPHLFLISDEFARAQGQPARLYQGVGIYCSCRAFPRGPLDPSYSETIWCGG